MTGGVMVRIRTGVSGQQTRIIATVLAAAAAVIVSSLVVVAPARADVSPPEGTPSTVTADALGNPVGAIFAFITLAFLVYMFIRPAKNGAIGKGKLS